MRKAVFAIVFGLLLAACQGAVDDAPIPTLAQLPSVTPSPTATLTATPTIPTVTNTPTNTPVPTDTPTVTLTPTETITPSNTPVPSATANATRALAGTGTAVVIEAPRFATFTPLPPGVIGVVRPTSTGTPQVVADVVISEGQFQEEVTRLLAGNNAVSQADVELTEQGVEVILTASGGDAFITGTFVIRFELSTGGLNNIVIVQPDAADAFVMQDGQTAPEEFVAAAHGPTTEAVFEAFNFILNQRLGEGQHDLEFIILENGSMGVTLLVPDPGQ